MGKIILVTGGSRSGKSSYALALGESLPGPRTFVATCPVTDDEMARRIDAHRRERGADAWDTVEEEVALADALAAAAGSGVVLVDCLTLWVNNIMYRASLAGGRTDEAEVETLSRGVLDAARRSDGTVVFVTNEVGMGIVPADAETRLYRDLVGRCNATIAAGADAVALVVCGIANIIKGVI